MTNKRNVKKMRQAVALIKMLVMTAVVLGASQTRAQTNVVVEEKKPQWEGSAGAGMSLTRGNSDTTLFNVYALADKKWTKDEVRMGATGSYGENDGQKNNQQAKASGQYNRTFGEKNRWYGYGRLEGAYDEIASLDARITVSPGLGYYFIKKEKLTLSGESGPGAVFEKYDGEEWESYFTLRLAERLEYKFNDKAKIWESVEYLPDMGDFNKYLVNSEIGIETSITKAWVLQVLMQDTYNSQPGDGSEENDLKLIARVGFKF
jgi:putative salt-induced outer membrane protein